MNEEEALGIVERAFHACARDGRIRQVRSDFEHGLEVDAGKDVVRFLISESEIYDWRVVNAVFEGRVVETEGAVWYELRSDSLARPRVLGFFAEVILTAPEEAAEVLEHLEVLLSEWEEVFAGVEAPLSKPAQRGLFGELIVLEHLLSLKPVPMKHWTGPTGHLHDFVFDAHHLEVKTSLRADPVAHVSEFDQFHVNGEFRLDLVFVALRLGGRSLVDIIHDLRSRLDVGQRREFEIRLGMLGYKDEDAHLYDTGYDVVSVEMRHITQELNLLDKTRIQAGTVFEHLTWRLRKSSIDGFVGMEECNDRLLEMW